MFLRQFHEPALGHASYLVADQATGTALVLDPRRDVDDYLAAARSQGLRIAYVLDSHGHNDYLSGITELRRRTDAQVLGYVDAPLAYDHRPVKDRELIEFGDVAVEILHTPGHTPEHVSLLVYDHAQGGEPAILLSGGALLVGDVARPDLLGTRDDARAAAAAFAHTLQSTILGLPDHVEVFPTHVAGSLCGGNIGSRLSTTVGYERRTQDVLQRLSQDAASRDVIALDNLPAVPPYWRRMRRQNLAGVAPLPVLPEPPALSPEAFEALQRQGALVVDTREPAAFGGGHIPDALNVGLSTSFPTWVGTVLPDNARTLLVLDRPQDLHDVTWHLLRIGYDVPIGWLAGGMFAWRTSARPVLTLPQITVHELKARLDRDAVDVVDVRQPGERAAGHIAGSTFITGAELPGRLDEVPGARPAQAAGGGSGPPAQAAGGGSGPVVAVVCGSGFRSSVCASLLSARTDRDVVNVTGGMAAWEAAGYPRTTVG